MRVERIIPADLDSDELWRRNGEYVDADSYDAMKSLISEAHDALHKVLTAFIPSNDGAHAEVSNLMERLRAAMSANQ